MANRVITNAKDADIVLWTNPSTAVAAGDLIQLGVAPYLYTGVAYTAIAASAVGSVVVKGRVRVVRDTGTVSTIGSPFYYSSSSAVTINGNSTSYFAGWAVTACAATTTASVDIDLAGPVARYT